MNRKHTAALAAAVACAVAPHGYAIGTQTGASTYTIDASAIAIFRSATTAEQP